MASLGGAVGIFDVAGGIGEKAELSLLGGVDWHLAVEEGSDCS